MVNIDNLTKIEAQELSKNLKKYNQISKTVWNRWKKMFLLNLDNKKELLIEYSLWLDPNEVLEKGIPLYKKVFWLEVKKQDIVLKLDEKLMWWIRLYYWDSMLDMSFKKILQNI